MMAAILNSWKEIATYLDRGVRTLQRWERDEHLPIRRVGAGERAPVLLVVLTSTSGFANTTRRHPPTI